MKGVVIEADRSVVAPRRPARARAGNGERVLEVRSAGINFLEVLVRRGRYPQPPELPWIPGTEVAGELDGRAWIGLKRQSAAAGPSGRPIDEDWLFPLPEGAGWAEGASFLMTFLTAWLPLTRQVSIRPGTRVLVTAAAGGVGSAAVQVAKVLGAQVCAAVGSERKKRAAALARRRPGRHLRRTRRDRTRRRRLRPGRRRALHALPRTAASRSGRAVAIGFAGGLWEPLDTARLVGRNSGVAGFYLGRLIQLEPQTVKIAAPLELRLQQGASTSSWPSPTTRRSGCRWWSSASSTPSARARPGATAW